MRTLIIDGRLGADAEIKTTKTGKSYLRFSLANTLYSNGQNTTEWFDVSAFDQKLIDNKIKILKKGTYVIVTGTPTTDVNVDKTNKVWVNQYLQAYSIELGASGKRDASSDNGMAHEGASTYTGGTPSENVASNPVSTQMPTVSTPQVAAASSEMFANNDDDDLPF